MYDLYGFIVNKIIKNGNPTDKGDSCFFMGLRSLIACIKGEYELAKKLYEKCKKIDFYRHPTILNDTSYDMMLIWDFIHYRFPQSNIELPPFHYRKSKFFTGKYRSRFFYYKLVAFITSNIFKLIKKKLQYKNYYKLHLLILYLATVYYKYNKTCKSILREMRYWVFWTERITGKPNHFFRWLSDMNFNIEYFWVKNANEWNYQRDPRTNNKTNTKVEFHNENGVDLSRMFYYAIIRNAKKHNSFKDKK